MLPPIRASKTRLVGSSGTGADRGPSREAHGVGVDQSSGADWFTDHRGLGTSVDFPYRPTRCGPHVAAVEQRAKEIEASDAEARRYLAAAQAADRAADVHCRTPSMASDRAQAAEQHLDGRTVHDNWDALRSGGRAPPRRRPGTSPRRRTGETLPGPTEATAPLCWTPLQPGRSNVDQDPFVDSEQTVRGSRFRVA